MRLKRLLIGGILVGLAGIFGAAAAAVGAAKGGVQGSAPSATGHLTVKAVSTRADRVSGGEVLIEIVPPGTAGTNGKPPAVTLDGADVAAAFRRTENGAHLGLVTGLRLGKNTLKVRGAQWGVPDQSLELTNYPSTGPIVSGPPLQPFVCQTDTFKLPNGSVIGKPQDANCSFPTRIDYVYLPAGGTDFKPMADTARLPADVATTTTLTGAKVPFVVRVETGAMNRGVYQNVILHDPTRDPAPTPFSPPSAWNRRLIAVHGTGCPGGWYRAGGVMGVNPLNVTRLGEGYALFTNSLNHPSNSCNPFLAGETTMMGKEHFIETFGTPFFTVSTGVSGGAYTSLQVADAFPGLFDGVLVTSTFPDALSIAIAGLDAHLLTHYFAGPDSASLTDAQKVAVSGYSGMKAFVDAANQAQRTDPVSGRADVPGYKSAVWHDAVPAEMRYDPTSNPNGARPTIFDVARNIYGVDPKTGAARRTFDNVGVQYGLKALNDGVIEPQQFLDLNERVGGVDHDANYVAARAVGDVGALRRTYQAGVTLGGGGGLASIPVVDAGPYNDADRYHYQWFHFAVRERMKKQNGRADNHLMWRGIVPAERSWAVVERWVTAVKSDQSGASGYDKVVRNKPADAVDGCWVAAAASAPATFIAEPQTFSSQPNSVCNTSYPSVSFVRQVAGGPLDGNVLKCELKPIDPKDYATPFGASDLQRLHRIFPNGVCDWSKPGVSQVPVLPWASFGPAPESRLSNVTN